jgi:hypothetical protein
MKPLIRWVVGPVSDNGFQSLNISVKNMMRLYPECDFAICHNQLPISNLKEILSWGIEVIDQSPYATDLSQKPNEGYEVHWKLFPPRIRQSSHEIVIDNDIILFNRVPEIDLFLKNDIFLSYQSLHEAYGLYEDKIPNGIRINSGIYGLPPNFDFENRVQSLLEPWTDKFDEQGLVAFVLHDKYRYVISQTTVPIIEETWESPELFVNPLSAGIHFVGINYSDEHKGWDWYKNQSILYA